jgi:hypothetical protein
MTKWCWYCETGYKQSGEGYKWMCDKCIERFSDHDRHIESIHDMLKGIHSRNKEDEETLETIAKYIKAMEDFRRRWENTKKLFY